jgi:hypothetical protein
MRSRVDNERVRTVADRLGISEAEVRRCVNAFFGVMTGYAKTLPFDSPTRIYTLDRFKEYVRVWNIPFVGRTGPVYGRYLAWRSNEAEHLEQGHKSVCRERMTQDEIETIAESVLSGGAFSLPKKSKKENYKRVWIVGTDGKRLARQVLTKQESNV